MPVYNSALYLRESIESILSQTFIDFEFLIINDGSTDDSKEILLSFQDTRIKYLENDKNEGLVFSLNRGLKEAKGRYIARMDADDISLSDRFNLQFLFLENNKDVDVVGGAFECFGEIEKTVIHPSTNAEIKERLFDYCCVGHPTVMFRRKVVDDQKDGIIYRKELFPCEDYYLWIELIRTYRFHNLKDTVLKYRTHSSQVSSERKVMQELMSLEASITHYQPEIGCLNTLELDVLRNLVSGSNLLVISANDVHKVLYSLIKSNERVNFFDSEKYRQRLSRLLINYYVKSKVIDFLLVFRNYTHSLLTFKDLIYIYRLNIVFILIKIKNFFR
jgi:glycosyltransferase involved in cell wall biosynthesis